MESFWQATELTIPLDECIFRVMSLDRSLTVELYICASHFVSRPHETENVTNCRINIEHDKFFSSPLGLTLPELSLSETALSMTATILSSTCSNSAPALKDHHRNSLICIGN